MDRLDYIYCLLQGINKYTLPLDGADFGSLFCMIAEDYCKTHNMDVLEFMSDMKDMATQVNEELGAY